MDTLIENIRLFSRQAAQLSHDANVAVSQGNLTKGKELIKQAVEAGKKCQNLILEQEENEEAKEDWGIAEQNAYERLLEGSSQNIPAEDFLEWLTELEEGKEV